MPLEGSLKDFGITDIIQMIGIQKKTGILTVKLPHDTIFITFLDGKIVNADSEKSRVENKLGRVLIKRGSITEEQLNKALAIQKDTMQRLGYILIKNGFISSEELKAALTQQILEVVYKIFRLREGHYYFSQEAVVEYDRESINPITTESVLMEGAQMLDEWPIIEKVVKNKNMIFEKTKINQKIEESEEEEADFDIENVPEKKDEVIKLSRKVFEVYNLVDGNSTVIDIIEKSKYNEFEVCKALYELYQRGLIDEKVEKAPVEEKKEEVLVVPIEEKPLKTAFFQIIIIIFILFFANLFRFKNPLNSFNSLIEKNNFFNDLKYTKTYINIYFLDNAIRTFYLCEGRYPATLQELFNYNLSDINKLVDPWNRGYLYLSKDKNYYLIGFNSDGTQSLELIYTYILSGGVEKEYREVEKKKKREIRFTE